MLAKRSVDVSISLVMLAFLLPTFALVALLIKLDSPGPAFFLQRRVGKDRRVFGLVKFRSMVQNTHTMGLGFEVARDDTRITRGSPA